MKKLIFIAIIVLLIVVSCAYEPQGSGSAVEMTREYTNSPLIANDIGVYPFWSGPLPANVLVDDYLWGFKDSYGNVIIEPQFRSTGLFFEGLAFVTGIDGEADQAGFIDMEGNVVISLPSIVGGRINRRFSNGLAPVILREWDLEIEEKINTNHPNDTPLYFPGPVVFIDRAGKIVFEQEFATARGFYDGLAFVRCVTGRNEQTGYIDLTGNLVIPLPEARYAGMFSDGFAVVRLREWDCDNENEFSNSQGPFIFIDRAGQNAFDKEFVTASPFIDGLALVTLLNGNVAFIDRTGQNAFGREFLVADEFHGGEFAEVVTLNRRVRYIDREGNLTRRRR